MKNRYFITYKDDRGNLEEKVVDESENELRARIECYKENGYKIKRITKEVIIKKIVEVEF